MKKKKTITTDSVKSLYKLRMHTHKTNIYLFYDKKYFQPAYTTIIITAVVWGFNYPSKIKNPCNYIN